jgi:hypothetical protein
VRNGYIKKVADKVGWPVRWCPTLEVKSNVRICPFPSSMRATKESNDFTSVKSLADYHICERFVTRISRNNYVLPLFLCESERTRGRSVRNAGVA